MLARSCAAPGRRKIASAQTMSELARAATVQSQIRDDSRQRYVFSNNHMGPGMTNPQLMLFRNRFETLSHMYQAVCHRLREVEQHDSGHSPRPPVQASLQPTLQPSTAMVTPVMGYPSPMGSPMPMTYMPYPQHHMYPSPLQAHGFANYVASPSPHRRNEGSANGDVLAGPLTPGHAPSATASHASSTHPSDLSLNPSATPSSSATTISDLSTAELRRINIASSVLKKKKKSVATDPSESGDSASAPASKPSDVADICEVVSADMTVEGLGIKRYDDVPSTFPSVNDPSSPTSPRNPAKQRSTDSISSDASSGPPGRPLLITPSDTGPKSRSPRTVMSPVPDNEEAFNPDDANEGTPCPHSKTKCFHSLNDTHDPTIIANGDAEFAPMFASLAHTPEQLQEIARIQSEALRNRELRTRPIA